MIRVSVMYPRESGERFDVDYYENTHFPLVHEKLDELGLVSAELDVGISGSDGVPSSYYAIGYLNFDSVEDFENAFAEVGKDLIDDIPNYTDVSPIIQISETQKL